MYFLLEVVYCYLFLFRLLLIYLKASDDADIFQRNVHQVLKHQKTQYTTLRRKYIEYYHNIISWLQKRRVMYIENDEK